MSEYAVSFQNQPVDVSEEFSKQESHFFVGSNIEEFDQQPAAGKLWWKSMALNQRVSYHQITLPLEDYRVWQDVPPRLSLWQLPYFNPSNNLHGEAIKGDYVVRSANGKPPVDDAVLDFSNPQAENWYQQKLAKLLEMGVGAIVADFGEAAPLAGLYFHREGAFYEHNLYPLRYNKAVADITQEVTGESIMWARSAWAGSQRYPLHWGGDPENTDGAMAGTLRGGLSLGLCGFSFWSHFIGGFPHESPEGLYGR